LSSLTLPPGPCQWVDGQPVLRLSVDQVDQVDQVWTKSASKCLIRATVASAEDPGLSAGRSAPGTENARSVRACSSGGFWAGRPRVHHSGAAIPAVRRSDLGVKRVGRAPYGLPMVCRSTPRPSTAMTPRLASSRRRSRRSLCGAWTVGRVQRAERRLQAESAGPTDRTPAAGGRPRPSPSRWLPPRLTAPGPASASGSRRSPPAVLRSAAWPRRPGSHRAGPGWSRR